MLPGSTLDVFAKRVSVNGVDAFERVRVFVDGDQATILSIDASGLVVMARMRVAEYERGRGRQKPAVLKAADGETWIVHRGGCGCGSSLMSLNPRQVLA